MVKVRYYQVSKSKAEKHEFMIYGIDESRQKPINDDCFIYEGVNLPENIYFDGEKIRESTRYERVRDGVSSLFENEFIKDGVIYNILDFKQIEGAIKQEFDFDKMEWIETATDEEIDMFNKNKKIELYSSELIFAGMANVEFSYGLISSDDADKVREYIVSINPYLSYKSRKKVSRPDVFNRYK